MTSLSRQGALDRFDRWRARYGHRLDALHPDVAVEVANTVRERFMAGNFDAMSQEDVRHCMMRVASRNRLKAGSIPAGEPGSGEQLRECVAAIDGGTRAAA